MKGRETGKSVLQRISGHLSCKNRYLIFIDEVPGLNWFSWFKDTEKLHLKKLLLYLSFLSKNNKLSFLSKNNKICDWLKNRKLA